MKNSSDEIANFMKKSLQKQMQIKTASKFSALSTLLAGLKTKSENIIRHVSDMSSKEKLGPNFVKIKTADMDVVATGYSKAIDDLIEDSATPFSLDLTKEDVKALSDAKTALLDQLEDSKISMRSLLEQTTSETDKALAKKTIDELESLTSKLNDSSVATNISKLQKQLEAPSFKDLVNQQVKKTVNEQTKGLVEKAVSGVITYAPVKIFLLTTGAIATVVGGFVALSKIVIPGAIVWYLWLKSDEYDYLQNIEKYKNSAVSKAKDINVPAGDLREPAQQLLQSFASLSESISPSIEFLLNVPGLKTATSEVIEKHLQNLAGYSDKCAEIVTALGSSPELMSFFDQAQGDVASMMTDIGEIISNTHFFFEALSRDISILVEQSKKANIDSPNPNAARPEPKTEGDGQATSGEKINKEIYGIDIDVSRYASKPAFISAIPTIINNVFNTPIGKAFVDPANYYGGLLGRKNSKEETLLNYLLFFYRNNIGSSGKLRSYVRKNYSKMERGRNSAFKDALKKYRGTSDDFSSLAAYNDKSFEKHALFDLNTINLDNQFMKLSNFSVNKNYFNSLIKNLDDEFMSSYYAGLKGMHNQKPKKQKPDYNKLYQVYDETGVDLLLSAHPNSSYIADAIGDGGLFENGLEQQAKIEAIMLSSPTGNFTNRYANFHQSLIKAANDADLSGDFEFANEIDQLLIELQENLNF